MQVISKAAEKQLYVLKIINILLGVCSSIIVPFSLYRHADIGVTEVILILTGIGVFLSISDFGISRPIYTMLKLDMINRHVDVYKRFTEARVLLFLLSLIGFLVFLVVSVLLGGWEFIYFGIFLAFNSLTAVYRLVYSGVDRYVLFEYYDLIRRVSFVLYFSIYYFNGHSILLDIIFSLINCTLYLAVVFWGVAKIKIRGVVELFNNLGKSAYLMLIFTFVEIFSANAGYILLPFMNTSVVEYSLWLRLYFGIAVIQRLITDVKIHSMIEIYHTQPNKLGSVVSSVIKQTFGIFIFFSIVINVYGDDLINIWLSGSVINSNFFFSSLILALFINIFHHSLGSLLLSAGKLYAEILTASIILAFLVILIFIFFSGSEYLLIMLVFSQLVSTMLLFSFTYFRRTEWMW
jgi:hypothetical protein